MLNGCLRSMFTRLRADSHSWLKPRRNTSADLLQTVEMVPWFKEASCRSPISVKRVLRPHELVCQPSVAELLEGTLSSSDLAEQPSSSELLDHQPQLAELLKNQPTPADLLFSL